MRCGGASPGSGGIADDIDAAVEAGELPEPASTESLYVGQGVPFELLEDVPWHAMKGAQVAEDLLRSVPVRWRLDVAHVVEGVIELRASGTRGIAGGNVEGGAV